MSGQNKSHAVMQQRTEARDALDDFPTPMWATRALMDWLEVAGHDLGSCIAREPCANRGYMSVPMEERFYHVAASDCHDYGVGFPVIDYLFGPVPQECDWTFMNPPFRLAQQFIERALLSSTKGVAVFVRSAFVEGQDRFETLFKDTPPTAILQFTERVVLHKSAMRRAGEKYWDPDHDNGEGFAKGKEKTASSATAYCWMLWMDVDLDPTEFHWLPPRRLELERPGDYDVRGANG